MWVINIVALLPKITTSITITAGNEKRMSTDRGSAHELPNLVNTSSPSYVKRNWCPVNPLYVIFTLRSSATVARALHSPARAARRRREGGSGHRNRGTSKPAAARSTSVVSRPSLLPRGRCQPTTADHDGIPLVVQSGHHLPLPPCRNMMGYNNQGHGYNKLFTQVRAQSEWSVMADTVFVLLVTL